MERRRWIAGVTIGGSGLALDKGIDGCAGRDVARDAPGDRGSATPDFRCYNHRTNLLACLHVTN